MFFSRGLRLTVRRTFKGYLSAGVTGANLVFNVWVACMFPDFMSLQKAMKHDRLAKIQGSKAPAHNNNNNAGTELPQIDVRGLQNRSGGRGMN